MCIGQVDLAFDHMPQVSSFTSEDREGRTLDELNEGHHLGNLSHWAARNSVSPLTFRRQSEIEVKSMRGVLLWLIGIPIPIIIILWLVGVLH